MANRIYLLGKQSDILGPNEEAVELLEASYSLPLLWMALFERKDIRLHNKIPVLITTRDAALANWASRKPALQKFLGRPAEAILAGWDRFIESQTSQYLFINTYELWLMDEEDGQLAGQLPEYFDELDKICFNPGIYRSFGILAQASKQLFLYPYQGSAVPLCGYTFGMQVPWPEETVKVPAYRFDAAHFLVEEIAPGELPLAAQIKDTLDRARERRLTPYVVLSASWCTPCIELFELFEDARLADVLHGTHLLKLDIDQWSGQLGNIGLQDVAGIPLLVELNEDGKASGRQLDGDAWDESTAEQVSAALGPFLREATPG